MPCWYQEPISWFAETAAFVVILINAPAAAA
jgi:hypothetical protein